MLPCGVLVLRCRVAVQGGAVVWCWGVHRWDEVGLHNPLTRYLSANSTGAEGRGRGWLVCIKQLWLPTVRACAAVRHGDRGEVDAAGLEHAALQLIYCSKIRVANTFLLHLNDS